MDASSWGIRSTSGTCWSAGKIPTEMVSLWTSRPRWIGVRCETLGTAGSFRMVAPPAPVWVTHADADRSRPFHAGYGAGGVGVLRYRVLDAGCVGVAFGTHVDGGHRCADRSGSGWPGRVALAYRPA